MADVEQEPEARTVEMLDLTTICTVLPTRGQCIDLDAEKGIIGPMHCQRSGEALMGKRELERKFRVRLRGAFCMYCGEWAQCLDHFPPHCLTYFGFLIPACLECNALAGDEYPYNFVSRARYVKERIERKYQRVLTCPTWSQNELRELGYGLRMTVTKWAALRKRTESRIAWNAISYLSLNVDGRDFAALFAEIDSMPGREPNSFIAQFYKIASERNLIAEATPWDFRGADK